MAGTKPEMIAINQLLFYCDVYVTAAANKFKSEDACRARSSLHSAACC